MISRSAIRCRAGGISARTAPGLIDVANGRRARVGATDGSAIANALDHAVPKRQVSVTDVREVRRTLELRTAALAAATRLDIAFHETIARVSRNPLFVLIVTSFAPLMDRAVPRAWQTRRSEAERATVRDNHLRLARAITDEDGDAARAAMAAHFDASVGADLERMAALSRLPEVDDTPRRVR